MRKKLIREECDTVDEIVAMFREFLGYIRANRESIEALKNKSVPKKKKGGSQ